MSVMPPRARVLLIGADSADPELIERWGAQGHLPNLMALKGRGAWGRIDNPPGLVSGSIWPVLHTGSNPGNQPQFDALRYFDPERYAFANYTLDELADPLWRILSRAGKRCFVMDAPYAPPERINGICIADWGAHIPARGGDVMQFTAYPEDAADEILELVGPDPAGQLVCDDRLPETLDDYRRFRDLHLDRIRKKAAVVKHFLAKGGWDYFEVVFCDLHCIGHHLWHVNDRRHPRYERALESALGEPLLDAYREVDKAIGEIMALVDERTLVLVYASHGIGPQYTGTGLLDRILHNLECGVQTSPSVRPVKDRLRDAWRALPPGVKRKLRPIKNRLVGEPPQEPFLAEKHARKYFEVYANNSAGGVRINLKGREAHGIVEPNDYDGLLDALSRDLREVINVESGEPLVEEIVKTHDHYTGPYLDRLPDLAVVWNKSHPIRVVSSPKIGTLRQEFAGPRTGDHTPSGAFYAVGAGVQAGALNHPVAPADFAPTLRLRLGLDAGSSDGMPIRPLLAGHQSTMAVLGGRP